MSSFAQVEVNLQRQRCQIGLLFVLTALPIFSTDALGAGSDSTPKVDTSRPASKSLFSYKETPAEDDAEGEDPPRSRRRGAKQLRDLGAEDEDDQDTGGGHWGFSGGLGMGDGYFAAQISVAYFVNPWVAIDTSGFYRSEKADDWSKTHYGPEVDLRLLAPNRTIFTPYVGAGPGYEKWRRVYNDVAYDDSGSLTGNYFIGLNIRLMRNFALQIARRTTMYLSDPPVKMSDRVTPEKNIFSRIEIQFQLSL